MMQIDPQAKIVFIHQRNSWYLPYALYQAKSISPASEIVLIGESKYEHVTCVALDSLVNERKAKEFQKSYIHMSSNPEWYELICFLRWYYLLEYMSKNNVNAVFYLDSDVLLYSSMKEISKNSLSLGPGVEFGAFLFHQGRATAGISYWTQKGLFDFCECLLDCYRTQEKLNFLKDLWKNFIDKGLPGGICDMTPISYFYNAQSGKIADLAKLEGGIFDCGINVSSNYVDHEFAMHCGMKKIEFKNSIPYVERNNSTYENVRAHALHFQGEAKGQMPLYYTGDDFSGKLVSDLKGFAYRMRKKLRGFRSNV